MKLQLANDHLGAATFEEETISKLEQTIYSLRTINLQAGEQLSWLRMRFDRVEPSHLRDSRRVAIGHYLVVGET